MGLSRASKNILRKSGGVAPQRKTTRATKTAVKADREDRNAQAPVQ